jgi:tetratricopeptide (TPR) repeat protein
VKLTGEAATGLTKRYTENNDAYQAYLKGRYFWNRRTTETLKRAIEQFKIATDLDPNFALAYVGLADCYSIMSEYGGTPTNETLPQATKYAQKALSIDENLAEAHSSMGSIYSAQWNSDEAEREYKRSIELNPNYPTAYHWYSIELKNVGRYDEARAAIEKAHQLDPLSPVISVNITRMLQLDNKHQDSVENSLKLIEMDPGFEPAYEYLALSYSKLGRHAEAITAAEKGVALSNRASIALGHLGYVYANAGKKSEALAVVKELESKYEDKEATGQYVSFVYAGLGENDKVFEWLEKDYADRSGKLREVRWQIPIEHLNSDPRMADLVKRVGLS